MSRISNILSTTAQTALNNNTVTLVGSSGQVESQDPILWTGQARFVSDDGKLIGDLHAVEPGVY
jgi:hypothetical protein